MADLSRLDVFKLILKRTTFREVAISKCGLNEAQVTENQIFNSLCRILVIFLIMAISLVFVYFLLV